MQSFATLPGSPLKNLRNRRRRRFVTTRGNIPSGTLDTMANRYSFSFLCFETVNRKVLNIQPFWMNTVKNIQGAGTDMEGTTGVATVTIDYAYDMPKTRYRDSANMFGWNAITKSTTNHLNLGGGSGVSGASRLVLSPGQVGLGTPLNAGSVAFAAGSSNTFPPRYHFFFRQDVDNGGAGKVALPHATHFWSAGLGERVRNSASANTALLSDTGDPSAGFVPGELLNHSNAAQCSMAPIGFIGEVDDSTDALPYYAVMLWSNSQGQGDEGGRGNATDPQTSTPPWTDPTYKWRLRGWLDEWAFSRGDDMGTVNFSCSQVRMQDIVSTVGRRDGALAAAAFVDLVVIHLITNDYGTSLPTLQANTITLINEAKLRGAKVALCTGFPYDGNANVKPYADWAAVLSNHGADFVWNPLPDLGTLTSNIWNWKGGLSSDGVHQNPAGKVSVIQSFDSFFNSIVTQLGA